MSQPANEPAPAPSLRQIPRRYLALGLIVVAIVLLGALVIVRDNSATSTPTVETFTAAPSSLVSTVSSVPASVYDAVGVSSPANPVTPPARTGNGNAPTWLATVNGGPPLPVVFFYGAEFAPYPAVERWPLIMALSRFGTFSQLGLMQSSSTTAFANLSTFTFWKVSYTSRYLILESVERYSSLNPTGARYLGLEAPDARQAAAVASYGTSANTFSLLDVANRYTLDGVELLARRARRALTGPDRRLPLHPHQPDDPGHGDGGQRDHGRHLLGRRRPARRRVRVEGRARRGPGAQDHATALTRRPTGAATRPAAPRQRGGGAAQLARRSSMSLRSTSFMPPQIPWGSRIRMA